ncbi:MAG: hypothetical protein ACRD4I_16460 [Candidatus Angelobacter sp.]
MVVLFCSADCYCYCRKLAVLIVIANIKKIAVLIAIVQRCGAELELQALHLTRDTSLNCAGSLLCSEGASAAVQAKARQVVEIQLLKPSTSGCVLAATGLS